MSNAGSNFSWEPIPDPVPSPDQIHFAGHAATPQHRLGGWALDLGLCVVTLGIGWFIWNLVVWSDGYTPAKKILKMRVIATQTGKPATWGHMAVRQFLIPLAIGLISIPVSVVTWGVGPLVWTGVDAFWIFNGGHRKRLTDIMAKTYVINEAAGF
jgi:uncharacterized RDD family membrane protein YckC